MQQLCVQPKRCMLNSHADTKGTRETESTPTDARDEKPWLDKDNRGELLAKSFLSYGSGKMNLYY